MKLRRLKFLAALWLAALGLFAAAGGAWAQADSPYGVYVQDDAGLLSQQSRDQLYSQAVWLHEKTATAQIGVVTVDSLGGNTIEQYAVTKYRDLGLGSKDHSDGVMLIYAKQEKRVRIEIGYGMEGRIPDGKAGAILDQYFVPNRDAGRLDSAFVQTQTALIREMAAEYGVDASAIDSGSVPAPQYDHQSANHFWNSIPWYLKGLAAAAVVLLIVLDFKFTGGAITYAIFSMIGRRGSSGGGGGGGGRGGGGSSGGGGASR